MFLYLANSWDQGKTHFAKFTRFQLMAAVYTSFSITKLRTWFAEILALAAKLPFWVCSHTCVMWANHCVGCKCGYFEHHHWGANILHTLDYWKMYTVLYFFDWDFFSVHTFYGVKNFSVFSIFHLRSFLSTCASHILSLQYSGYEIQNRRAKSYFSYFKASSIKNSPVYMYMLGY